MEEKTDITKKDGKLNNNDILSIVMILIACVIVLTSFFLEKKDFSISIKSLCKITKFIGFSLILCFLYRFFLIISIKTDYLYGYVILPIIIYLFQFIACGDDLKIGLKIIYISIVFILLIYSLKKIGNKKNDLVRSFLFSLAILALISALFYYIYDNLSTANQDYLKDRSIKQYFSTSVFILAIISFYCGLIEFKIYLENKNNKKNKDGQNSNNVLSENSTLTEIALPKQEPVLSETPLPKEVNTTTQTSTTQTDANKVTLKEVRETFYHLRDFEISNLWQRSVFLTAFLVLLFTVYSYVVSGMLKNDCNRMLVSSEICCGIGLIGFAFSIIWIMMAKGSKAWYEIYERRIRDIEKERELGIPKKYRMGADMRPWNLDSNIFTKKAGMYSVSKLNIMIGLVLLVIWFFICVIHYTIAIMNCSRDTIHTVILTLLPVVFLVILITALCNSWSKSNSIQNPND